MLWPSSWPMTDCYKKFSKKSYFNPSDEADNLNTSTYNTYLHFLKSLLGTNNWHERIIRINKTPPTKTVSDSSSQLVKVTVRMLVYGKGDHGWKIGREDSRTRASVDCRMDIPCSWSCFVPTCELWKLDSFVTADNCWAAVPELLPGSAKDL